MTVVRQVHRGNMKNWSKGMEKDSQVIYKKDCVYKP